MEVRWSYITFHGQRRRTASGLLNRLQRPRSRRHRTNPESYLKNVSRPHQLLPEGFHQLPQRQPPPLRLRQKQQSISGVHSP